MNLPESQIKLATDPASAAAFAVKLTSRIWEEKAIGLIYRHYVHSVFRHQSSGESYGREEIVAQTIQTLAAFPDLRLFGHGAICAGNEAEGFWVSHRFTCSAHHLGHGAYGPPTRKRIQQRLMVQQRIQGGRVVEEWSVQDETALLTQLGLDPLETAQRRAREETERGLSPPAYARSEVPRLPGQWPPDLGLSNNFTGPAQQPELLYEVVWNARMLNRLTDLYAPDATIRMPGDRKLQGPSELAAYILELLAAFPDGAMQLDALMPDSSEGAVTRVAARWTFQGTHRGAGLYGAATGRRVRVTGISHFELRSGQIIREDTLWDELALLEQLSWPGPEHPNPCM